MKAVFTGVFVALLASFGNAQTAPDAATLIERAGQNQGRSLFVRDRCRYEQRLLVERFKYDKKKQESGELLAKRQTTVVVEPAEKPDETGLVPVVTRVVADTNDKGEPREKVDPHAQTGLASGAFLDQIFFPLLPENLTYLTFAEVESEVTAERWFEFKPNPNRRPDPLRPLASGLVKLDAATGEVLTIRITGFTDLRSLDKHLEKIFSFTAVVDYSQFSGKLRMPTNAAGSGISDVSRFQGYFKFVFEEGKYAPVGKID